MAKKVCAECGKVIEEQPCYEEPFNVFLHPACAPWMRVPLEDQRDDTRR